MVDLEPPAFELALSLDGEERVVMCGARDTLLGLARDAALDRSRRDGAAPVARISDGYELATTKGLVVRWHVRARKGA